MGIQLGEFTPTTHRKGLETIVDTSVCNTLQVDPSNVTLNNPVCGPLLLTLVCQAAEALRVSPNLVQAGLNKLLLYEPGGSFKKHHDTEKAKGNSFHLISPVVCFSSAMEENWKHSQWV